MAGVEALSPEAVRVALREEVTRATKSRTSRDHIRLLTVLQEPYTPENGCLVRLTRTCCRSPPPPQPYTPSPSPARPLLPGLAGVWHATCHLAQVLCSCQMTGHVHSRNGGRSLVFVRGIGQNTHSGKHHMPCTTESKPLLGK